MTDDYFDKKSKWYIGLYEKTSSFSEVGQFFDEITTADEAFDVFNAIADPIPTWQVIERALEMKANGQKICDYEVRMFNSGRCVGSFLWTSASVAAAVESLPPRKKYRLTIDVDVFEYEQNIEPIFWDWEEMVATNRLEVICAEPPLPATVDESSEGGENGNEEIPMPKV
jgi:hypothetical protein